jgi:hypothetical protein
MFKKFGRTMRTARTSVLAASLYAGGGAPIAAGADTPYYPFKHFMTNTKVKGPLALSILHASSAGFVFSLSWSLVQPNCDSFTFSSDAKDVLGFLAANLRADQMIWPGIGGGSNAPACLANLGIPTAKIFYAFANETHDPCVKYAMPLMSDPAYGTLYVAANHAMLLALAGIPVASGGTLADRVAGIELGAYAAVSTELQIPARGCSAGSVHQSAAHQVHLWEAAGYQGSQAISTYAAILQGILTDPALPASARVLQDTTGGEGWSFPQFHDAQKVLGPILAASTQTWGNRFVISWNVVSGTGPLPPATIIAAAQRGTPVALEFNSTAVGFTTSCRGILANGKLDPITAKPACFHAMQPRNAAVIPSPLVLWQVEPADFAVRGFFK